MSYTSIQIAVRDVDLQDRVRAAAMKEAFSGADEFSESEFGKQLRQSPTLATNAFQWPTCIDYEDEYEFALNNSNPAPGKDPGVISDANIQAVVQTYWPLDPVMSPQLPDPSQEPA